MNTMLRSSNAPTNSALAPSSLTTTGRPPVGGGGVHKGVWIGGGLMALTIVALATALVVRSNGSGSETAAPLASTVPTATAPLAGTPDAGAVPPATTVAQAPVAQAPMAQAPVQAAPVHTTTTHHTATHSTGSGTSAHSGGGNTTVADAGGNGAGASPSYSEPARNVPPPVCTTCGTIDSYDAVKVAGQANGVGAVGGGAVGAVVGSQIAGRHNHTLGGVIGAIGGGLLGNEIEKSQRTTTVYDVHVRMDDGSMRTIRQSAVPVVGSKVTVQGNSIGARSSGGGSGNYNGGGTSYQSQPSGNGGSSFSPSGN